MCRANSFSFNVPAKTIFTLKSTGEKNITNAHAQPEPAGWYAGDIHVHRNCGDGTILLSYEKLVEMMEPNDLSVISVLADMGNGEVKVSEGRLTKS